MVLLRHSTIEIRDSRDVATVFQDLLRLEDRIDRDKEHFYVMHVNSRQQSRADLSYQKKIQAYLKPDLLILDELGYRSMAERTVEDFFEIISRRYEKGSLILTTNRELKEWDKVFIDKTLTSAIVDRFLHHARIIEIKGESYRFRNRD